MKQSIIIVFLTIPYFLFSQEPDDIKTHGLFYKGSFAATLTINEDFEIGNEDDEVLINPSAFFINNTIGYQFDERTSIGLNAELDWHSKQGLLFFPTYLSLRYNIFVDDDNIFIRGGYGRLLNLGSDFEKGTLYKAGVGVQVFDGDYKNSILFGVDFSRKRFGFRQTEKLSSVSVFLELIVF